MAFWLKVIFGYVAIATILILILGWDWQTGIAMIAVSVPFLTATIHHIPRFYLFLSRLKYTISNRETIWSLSLEFYGNFTREELREVVDSILKENPKENALIRRSDREYVFRYHRILNVEIALDELDHEGLGTTAESKQRIGISILDQSVSYRTSKRLIENKLIPFFERLSRELKPDKCKYTLRVGFDGPNPFFGFYTQQMNLDAVREFTFEFKVPTSGEGDYVRVAKEEMTVVSTSQEGLRKAALSALAFSSVGRS